MRPTPASGPGASRSEERQQGHGLVIVTERGGGFALQFPCGKRGEARPYVSLETGIVQASYIKPSTYRKDWPE